jgi:hypothetical protein
VLRRIFAATVEAGYLLRSPCSIKGAGNERPAEVHIPTVAEVSRLADAIDERYRAMVLVAAYGRCAGGSWRASPQCGQHQAGDDPDR